MPHAGISRLQSSERNKSLTGFREKVYSAVKRIPRGKVTTYAALARAIGHPRAVRAVGNALNKNSFRSVPCHRVIRADGVVGGYLYGTNAKIKRLRKEGVLIRQNKVAPEFIVRIPRCV